MRVIKGRYFHRCTLSCQIEGKDGQIEDWKQEFGDIEELEDGSGWRLIGLSSIFVFIKPETSEDRAYWEKRLFTDSP